MKNTTRTATILALLLTAAPALVAQSVDAGSAASAVADSIVKSPPDSEPKSPTASQAKAPVKEPFAFADFTWMTGNSRQKFSVLDTKAFTGEFRADINYIASFNRPKDHTIVGSTEVGREGEIQLQQLGIGGDFHYGNSRGRLMTQFGMYSTMTPRNDASPARGQWDLSNAYRYISEGYGGYHWNKLNGINLDGGIFLSYIGLYSYYNFDNWSYQPSYVSSNTPWFFTGLRLQIFTSDHLKIEPWLINGWQSYGMFNHVPGVGAQVQWRPNGSWIVISNNYYGKDWLGIPDRWRVHTDNSIEAKYHEDSTRFYSKGAFSVTADIGCESGGAREGVAVSCRNGTAASPSQNFLGFMVYNRSWFAKDVYGLTLGGGGIINPGRYLVLLPPINGATAFSGTPYFTQNPGDQFKAWDVSATFDYMPDQFTTFRFEWNHRAANVPYFAGSGGVTPPGGNTGPLGSVVPGFTPDLVKTETRLNLAMLIKF
jgi:hypothetical protein